MSQLNFNLVDEIYTDAIIKIDNQKISIARLLNNNPSKELNLPNDKESLLESNDNTGLLDSIIMINKEIEDIIEGFTDDYNDFLPNKSSSSKSLKTSPTQNPFSNKNSISYPITVNSNIILPAGIQAYIKYTDDNNNDITVDISIPANLDSIADKSKIINNLSLKPYNNLTQNNIMINKYPTKPKAVFSYIPFIQIITYMNTLCNDMLNIYNQPNISNLLAYLKIAPNIEIIKSLSTIINTYLSNKNINSLLLKDFINDLSKVNINTDDTSNLLGLILHILKNMLITYDLTYLTYKPSDIDIKSANNMQLIITSFNNDFVSNIPNSDYNILSNTDYTPLINTLVPNITSFLQFITNNRGTTGGSVGGTTGGSVGGTTGGTTGGSAGGTAGGPISLPSLYIYKPNPPQGYVALGHVFCNSISELQKIIDSENVACVPSHCVKEIRDWVVNDKVFEYNSNNVYWAIYFNPYIGTFISTNTNAQKLPEGKVCKVVACVTKNNTVDKLVKSDECIRQYYNLNKKSAEKSPISSKLVSDQEEVFYLEKIKSQSDNITRLQQRSKQMQTDIDKSTIINREMNKHKLQEYTDTQKRNINIIMQKLKNDNNKIQTNINIPLKTLNDIINMINNLPKDQQEAIISVLDSNNILTKPQMNQIINSCPQYDLTGLIKKSTASDVCYGCDTPK